MTGAEYDVERARQADAYRAAYHYTIGAMRALVDRGVQADPAHIIRILETQYQANLDRS